MKQKIVIKVSMNDEKSRSKALKIVVGVPGVQSAALGKKDKNQIEVIGEAVDAVKLTSLLRNKLGNKSCLTCFLANQKTHAEILIVKPIGGKADEEDEEKESKVRPVNWSYSYGCSVPQYFICY
ncbi:heavy metal-associated isoprenylated plant protein 16-like [Jatropha curcas]|uniref:heavy metal-associated isoprenylated plant protein 16-like n=1 Tax=Jatropha curcas TaxID=180498 RepID=UPI0009D7062C|nr:heavy metal-associated isoprenylated plant protein 16-like [Jatropha curcas]